MTTRIEGDLQRTAGRAFLTAAGFLGVGGAGLAIASSRSDGASMIGLFVVCVVVGLLALMVGSRTTLSARRLGTVVLELERAAIGAELAGTLECDAIRRHVGRGHVTLTCTQSIDPGPKQSAGGTTLHQSTHAFDLAAAVTEGGRTKLAIRLPIPAGLPPSGTRVEWSLVWHVYARGVTATVPFRVPVSGEAP